MLVALVGQPNSGKSAILAKLTGARVMTSNYPGTTVELVFGRIPDSDVEVLDTPGIYSLHAFTREQQVTRDVLEGRSPDLVVNVIDGTNLHRHLSLTLALLHFKIPMLIAVNCVDRLRDSGFAVDETRLSLATGARVVSTSAATGEGMDRLMSEIRIGRAGALDRPDRRQPQDLQDLHDLQDLQCLQREAAALADSALIPLGANTRGTRSRRARLTGRIEDALDRPLAAYLGLGAALAVAWKFISWALPFSEAVVRLLLDPVGVYLARLLSAALPKSPLSVIISDALTEGIVLPLATVLPAMILAYSLIALLEDTGLLSRYAALGDLLTGTLNLPGQALIPFMLGFGCRVPGLLSARILPSQESRRNASILIAALVPCAATVSLAWTTLARFRGNPLVPIVALLVSTFALARLLRLTSGSAKDPLVLELPPLRMPTLGNMTMKTQMRLSGFFTGVLPLVIAMNVAIRLLMAYGSSVASGVSSFARTVFGIPPQAFVGVLLTMLQRYLAPLFLLQQDLTPREATIAVTMVALGFPCLPSTVTLWREQGPSAVLLTFLASACLFMGWGALLNLVLP